jgi:SAM-dependent methyltransferase
VGETVSSGWACPRCRGGLDARDDSFSCRPCDERYPIVGGAGGIPDFRSQEFSRSNLADDRAQALRLLAQVEGHSAEETIRHIFAARPHWTPAQIERRTREVLAAPARLETQLGGWLEAALVAPSPLLDIGCGPGGLLGAVAARGGDPIGIDTSLSWLIAARVVLRERGLRARLAAAHAEALPLADDAVGATVSLDVIEHVNSPSRMLCEVDRVTQTGGVFLFSTPNRYSLAAEPHVGVWGVGWLPRSLQAPYVQWRRGDAYEGTQLLSGAEIARLVRAHTRLDLRLETPSISHDDIALFSPYRARLALLYNRLAAVPALRPLWLRFAPFYRATCSKP